MHCPRQPVFHVQSRAYRRFRRVVRLSRWRDSSVGSGQHVLTVVGVGDGLCTSAGSTGLGVISAGSIAIRGRGRVPGPRHHQVRLRRGGRLAAFPCSREQPAGGVTLAPQVRDDEVRIVGADAHPEPVLDELPGWRRGRDIVSVKELKRHHGVRNREQGDRRQVARTRRNGHGLAARGIYVVRRLTQDRG